MAVRRSPEGTQLPAQVRKEALALPMTEKETDVFKLSQSPQSRRSLAKCRNELNMGPWMFPATSWRAKVLLA